MAFWLKFSKAAWNSFAAEEEMKSPYSTAITPLQQTDLKYHAKNGTYITYCLSLNSVQVFTVCIPVSLSDYQDYFNY